MNNETFALPHAGPCDAGARAEGIKVETAGIA